MKKFIVFIIVCLSIPSAIFSSKIVLLNGRYVFGEILKRSEKFIEIKTTLGVLNIPTEIIASITDEVERLPPINQNEIQLPFKNVDREFLRLSLKYGVWKWESAGINSFYLKSFDYWNRVGEVNAFNGDTVEKSKKPFKTRMVKNFEIRLLKRSRIFHFGLILGTFENISMNQVIINNNRYFDEFKLTGFGFGGYFGLAQIAKNQFYYGIAAKGNVVNLKYKSNENYINSNGFFINLELVSGYVFDIASYLALKIETSYIIATKPILKRICIRDFYDEYYKINRPIIFNNFGTKIKFKSFSYTLSIGFELKILKKYRLTK